MITAMKVENMSVEDMIRNYVQAHGIDDGHYRIHHPIRKVSITSENETFDIVSVKLSDADKSISLTGMSPRGTTREFRLGDLSGIDRETLIQ